MTKERRPLSVDVWNRPWPPKYMEGDPRPPVKRCARPPETPPELPLPPPVRENWIAVVLAATSGVLLIASAFTQPWGWTSLPFLPYFLLLARGAFRVRPAADRPRAFLFWFSTILLQLALHVLSTWELLAQGLNGVQTVRAEAFQVASLWCFVLGWIPAAFLHGVARRAGFLLVVLVLYPLGILVLAGILLGIAGH